MNVVFPQLRNGCLFAAFEAERRSLRGPEAQAIFISEASDWTAAPNEYRALSARRIRGPSLHENAEAADCRAALGCCLSAQVGITPAMPWLP